MQDLFDALLTCMNKNLVSSMETERTNEYFKVDYDPKTQIFSRRWVDETGVCFTKVNFPLHLMSNNSSTLYKLADYIYKNYPNQVRHVEVRGPTLWIYYSDAAPQN